MTFFRAFGHFLVASWLLATGTASAAQTLLLADNGRAMVPIVVSPKASRETRAAAEELAHCLKAISGAQFEVIAGNGSKGIVVGTISEFPIPRLKEALALRGKYDGREAFAIRTEEKRVLLVGAIDFGASHAVYRFLELLGCRWFFPAQEWEVIPRQPKLEVAFNEADRPAILSRRIWYGFGAFSDRGHPDGKSALIDYNNWARRNRMSSSFRTSLGHAWQTIIKDNAKAFAEHPEYLALVAGERQGDQLCVSNPGTQQVAIQWALSQLESDTNAEMVSMECSDGRGQCECEECAKLGAVSNRVFSLANIVAREVNEKFPGRMVGVLAYSEHSEPPSFELEPNVYVQLTNGFTRGRYTHEELLELWRKKCRNLGFYEYFSVWQWDHDQLPGGNAANLTRSREVIRRYAELSATSVTAESGNNWGVHGLGYYVANKLLWNPEADVDAITEDFFEKAFGPAAPAMKRYYERVAPDEGPINSRGLIGEAFRDVEEAARLAKDRPDVLARLDQIKHYLRYVHLRWLLDHSTDPAERKRLTIEAITHVYRTRYAYMNHWAAMRKRWASDAAKEFNEPTWVVEDPAPKPWIIEKPVTRDETEEWFAEGLEYFKPQPVVELSFEGELAPVEFRNGKLVVSQQGFARPAKYALYSAAGEPLEVEITTGVIAHYRDRADTRYTLRDGANNLVAEGRLPPDGEEHSLSLSVSKPGDYFFTCDDFGAGWRMKVPANRRVALLLDRRRQYDHLGRMQEMFFYVPKGTTSLQYFWEGPPHKVIGPDGKLIQDVFTAGEVVTIPVPAGADGQCWSFQQLGRGRLWLYNAPNILAASPNMLLLPRELIERDSLSVASD